MTGNICRSPIAEGVFQKALNDRQIDDLWEVDSAAIRDWNVGKRPATRARSILKKYKIPYHNVGRQISSEDFHKFDYIFGMDENNMKDLYEMAPRGSKAKVILFGEFDSKGDRIIRDPYWDTDKGQGFEKCYRQAVRCTEGFLDHLEKEK